MQFCLIYKETIILVIFIMVELLNWVRDKWQSRPKVKSRGKLLSRLIMHPVQKITPFFFGSPRFLKKGILESVHFKMTIFNSYAYVQEILKVWNFFLVVNKKAYILVPPNLIENDHNFVFFDYKVSTQQHFQSHLFWKKAEKLRIHA